MTHSPPPLATIIPTDADLDAREAMLRVRERRSVGIPDGYEPRPSVPTPRINGFTAPRQRRFLESLADGGNVQIACELIDISRKAVYRLRNSDPVFAQLWDAAMVIARDMAEQTLLQRALKGVEEEVWHRGEVIGTRMRKDPRWMALLLQRLDRIADRPEARQAAANFETLLDALASPTAMRIHNLDEREARMDREDAAAAQREVAPPRIEARNAAPPPPITPNTVPAWNDPIWTV